MSNQGLFLALVEKRNVVLDVVALIYVRDKYRERRY